MLSERRRAHLIRVMIRRGNLDRCRKIEDDPGFPSTSFAPCSFDSLTDLESKLWLGLGICLWTVFILEDRSVLGRALLGELADKLGVAGGEFDCLFLGVSEDNIPEGRRCCVVHVQDCVLGAGDGIDSPSDEIFSGRRQDLEICKYDAQA